MYCVSKMDCFLFVNHGLHCIVRKEKIELFLKYGDTNNSYFHGCRFPKSSSLRCAQIVHSNLHIFFTQVFFLEQAAVKNVGKHFRLPAKILSAFQQKSRLMRVSQTRQSSLISAFFIIIWLLQATLCTGIRSITIGQNRSTLQCVRREMGCWICG